MTNSSVSRQGRASDRRYHLFIRFALSLLVAAQVSIAAAQDSPGIGVLVVDMQRIQREALAATSVREQSAAMRSELEKAITERAAAISREEAELAEIRKRLSTEEFAERVRDFEEKVFANRDFAQRESGKLQALLADASTRLRRRIAPILATLMRERNAQLMLDTSQVVLSAEALDVTEEVIRRLDEAVPTMDLTPEQEPQ